VLRNDFIYIRIRDQGQKNRRKYAHSETSQGKVCKCSHTLHEWKESGGVLAGHWRRSVQVFPVEPSTVDASILVLDIRCLFVSKSKYQDSSRCMGGECHAGVACSGAATGFGLLICMHCHALVSKHKVLVLRRSGCACQSAAQFKLRSEDRLALVMYIIRGICELKLRRLSFLRGGNL